MRIVAILVLLFLSLNLSAQDPEYYSYLVKGQVQCKKGKAKPMALAPKTLLYVDDVIILPKGKNSEITLVDKKSNYITISSPGSYKVADLPQKPHKEPESITGKYFHLVWEELFQPQKDFSRFKKKNLPGIVGGVSRGDCDVLKTPLNETVLRSGDIKFNWKKFSTDPLYTFVLSDESNKELLRLKVRDTQLIVNTSSVLVNSKKRYFWKVSAPESACSAFPTRELSLWSNGDIVLKIAATKDQIKNEGDTVLYHIRVAETLEKDFMFEEVDRYYKTAIEETNDPIIRAAYASFLLRMEREQEAELVYLGR